jgi:hypothetical protein
LRFFALLVLALAGCASVKNEAAAPVQIVWEKVDDVQAACEQVSGRRELFRVMGCSRWREADGRRTCTIYAAAPRSEADTQRFATLGHELMHCTDGSWHDKWGRMHDEKVREARRSREGSAAAGGSAAGLPLDR